MKVVGILFMGLIAGIGAAIASLMLGGGLWSAILNYLAFGTAATFVSVAVLFLRAIEDDRPTPALTTASIKAATGR